MSTPAPRSGKAAALIQLWRHDLLFPPAVLVVVFGVGAMLLAPPAWLSRVPTAVKDVATNSRATLTEDLEQTRRRLDEAERTVAALTVERDQSQSGAATLDRELAEARQALDAAQVEDARRRAIHALRVGPRPVARVRRSADRVRFAARRQSHTE